LARTELITETGVEITQNSTEQEKKQEEFRKKMKLRDQN